MIQKDAHNSADRLVLRILARDFQLEADQEGFWDPIREDFSAFRLPISELREPSRVVFRRGWLFLGEEGRDLRLHPAPSRLAAPVVLEWMLAQQSLFEILHGAVLGFPKGALLINGPSGAGKTTLLLDLLDQGGCLFSDDYGPVSRLTGLVHPFPRVMKRVDPQTQHLPPNARKKISIPPIYPIAQDPAPLAYVVLLEGGGALEENQEAIRLSFCPGAEGAFLDALKPHPQISIQLQTLESGPSLWLRFPKDRVTNLVLRDLIQRHRSGLWKVFKVDERHPHFSQKPRIQAISPHQAAFRVLREMKKDPFTQESRPGAWLLWLTGIFSQAACFSLSPGWREDRLKLVQGVLDA